ncbi:MAG: cell division protein FtsZ [Thermoplasmata archaeon]|nr:cell division protein FtsZ [Thermoplasmata archaeon]
MNATEQIEPRVAVVGVGGAGCNVVSSFYGACLPVDTIAINTDKEGLHNTKADLKLYICREVLHGEGAQGDAVLGRRCADIHIAEIREALSSYDVVFVVAGLGGGTGSGAMPVVIDAAQSQGIDTYAIAISPFTLEGSRKAVAREAWGHIRAVCEGSIIVDNDLVLARMPQLTVPQAFGQVNLSIRKHIMGCIDTVSAGFRNRKVPAETDMPEPAYPIEALSSA